MERRSERIVKTMPLLFYDIKAWRLVFYEKRQLRSLCWEESIAVAK